MTNLKLFLEWLERQGIDKPKNHFIYVDEDGLGVEIRDLHGKFVTGFELGGEPDLDDDWEDWEYTKDQHVEWLNELPYEYDSDEWIIGGKNRWNEFEGKYGEALRAYDPVGFHVSYNDRYGQMEYEQAISDTTE